MTRNLWILLMTLSVLVGCGSAVKGHERNETAEFHYKLANGHFYEHQIVLALTELTKCLKHDPDHPDAHHLMGFILMGRKEYATAERHFRRALRLRPAFHTARANLGVLLIATRRWAEGISVLTPLTTATLYGTPWLVHNNLGLAHEKMRRWPRALKQYRLAIFHNPKFCLGYNNLGALYKRLGQRDLAIDYLNRATSRCKKYAEPHFHLGEIYEEVGRPTLARQSFGQCYKVAPESPYGRRCRVRM